MNKLDTFNQFLAAQSPDIELLTFVASLSLATVLSLILAQLYVRFGVSLSNRRSFARNFVLISMTTMIIITIVKSSLALSLGLVGALSIVRFRAAIKEPEELAYLFLAIAVGLGCGANQWKVTLIGFIIVSLVIVLSRRSQNTQENDNLHLTVASQGKDRLELMQIIDTMKKYCSSVYLMRFDEGSDLTEVPFTVDVDNMENVAQVKNELRTIDSSVQITFMDSRGLS